MIISSSSTPIVKPVEVKLCSIGRAGAYPAITSPDMAATAEMTSTRLEELLGDDADSLLNHRCETFPASQLHLPGPDFIDRVFVDSDRPTNVLRNLQWLVNSGRLAG